MGSHIVRKPRYLFCFWAGLMMAAWAAETRSHTLVNFIVTYYRKLLCLDVNIYTISNNWILFKSTLKLGIRRFMKRPANFPHSMEIKLHCHVKCKIIYCYTVPILRGADEFCYFWFITSIVEIPTIGRGGAWNSWTTNGQTWMRK